MAGIQRSIVETTTPAGTVIKHHYWYHDDAATRKLLVMLPGRGYTVEYPLLHYLRRVAVDNSYDVLSVQYSFQANPDVHVELPGWDALTAEIDAPINKALERGYEQVCIAGKSMGTPLTVTQAQKLNIPDLRLILLTPIGDSVAMSADFPTLAIIGTADPSYDSSKVAADKHRSNVVWHVFEGLNHSLEDSGNWERSIVVLKEIMTLCRGFLL